EEGIAPRVFARLSSRGVPVPALLATAAVGLFAFLTNITGDGGAYTWLLNVSGLSGFIVWVGISGSHFRFRRGWLRQGHSLKELPYVAPFFPLGPMLALLTLLVVIAGQNYQAVLEGHVLEVVSAYIGLPIFGAVWLIHRLVAGRSGRMVALEEMDVRGISPQDLAGSAT